LPFFDYPFRSQTVLCVFNEKGNQTRLHLVENNRNYIELIARKQTAASNVY